MTTLVLGIDASTTACKAVVWNLRGEEVAQGRAALPLSRPQPLWHEQPAEAWWTALQAAVREALAGVAGSGGRIVALAIAPQRETFVPVDVAGVPLRPAILWMDERCRALLPALTEGYGAARFHRESGKPLSGNLTVGKIAWLRAHEPAVFHGAAHYLDVAGFLTYRLTGEMHTGWGCADPTGLFDMGTEAWNAPLLAYLGVDVAQMPAAFPPGAVVGTVTARAAEACGLPQGLPVVAGIGDGQACGLGAGIVAPGLASLNLGTSVVSGTCSERFVVDRAFRTLYHGAPGAYCLETALLGGTYTIDWFLGTFLSEVAGTPLRPEAYEAALDATVPGAEGLVVVPYWNSAMAPYWDADASGLVVGWRGIHTPAHLYRAILEGIAMEQRLQTEGVEVALGAPIEHYVAMGGGARSARWCQIIADVTGKPVIRAAVGEAAALGAGMLAAVGAGCFADVRQAAAAMARVEPEPFLPDSARHAFYSELYEEVYRRLFPAVQRMVDRLTALTVDRLDVRNTT